MLKLREHYEEEVASVEQGSNAISSPGQQEASSGQQGASPGQQEVPPGQKRGKYYIHVFTVVRVYIIYIYLFISYKLYI